MSVTSNLRIQFENIRSLGFASISNTYMGVGTSFVNPVRLIKVTNLTNEDLLISFDGVDDKDVIAAGSAFIYDYGSNKGDVGGVLSQEAGERVYVKYINSAPTSGSLYVTVIYVA